MSDAYSTKTLRFHLPERGQYFYVMLTRFRGDETVLSEMGYGSTYIQYQVMTNNKGERLSDTDLFNLAHRSGYQLRDLYVFDLLYAIDRGEVPWGAIGDGQQLTEPDVRRLLGEVSH